MRQPHPQRHTWSIDFQEGSSTQDTLSFFTRQYEKEFSLLRTVFCSPSWKSQTPWEISRSCSTMLSFQTVAVVLNCLSLYLNLTMWKLLCWKVSEHRNTRECCNPRWDVIVGERWLMQEPLHLETEWGCLGDHRSESLANGNALCLRHHRLLSQGSAQISSRNMDVRHMENHLLCPQLLEWLQTCQEIATDLI